MADNTITTEYVKQLEETIETLKSGQVEYIKNLEETNEALTRSLEGDMRNGFWFDRHVDNNIGMPVIRSDLKIMGVCVAYVVLKDEKWSVYYLRREESKKFSGYRFCRLEGAKNKPSDYMYHFAKSALDIAKGLAVRAIR
jgi:hypothetical protein